MNRETLSDKDYPLAENRTDLVRGRRGKSLGDLSLAALEQGNVVMEDMRITPDALTMQADIARTEHRDKLAENFDRAAGLIDVPQEYLMQIYELLRPGRAHNRAILQTVADTLRATYNAPKMAVFIEEAAEIYHRRGLFKG